MPLSEEEDLQFREIVVATLMKTLVNQFADAIDVEVERRVSMRIRRMARAVAALGQDGLEDVSEVSAFDEQEERCKGDTTPQS